MTEYRFWLAVIILITLVSVWIDLPDNPGLHIDFNDDGEEEISADFNVVQGLDLQGGSRILLRPTLSDQQYNSDDLEVARDIVERRVNGLGLSEAVVQLQGSNRVLVELPGVNDRDVALATVQSTGLLEFVDYAGIEPSVLTLVSQPGACIKTTEQERLDAARNVAPEEGGDQGTVESTATPPLPDEVTPEATQDIPPFGKVITDVPGENVAQEGDGGQAEEEQGPCPDGSFPVGTTGTPDGPPFRTVMTGAGLDDAAAVFDGLKWEVSFTLNSEGNDLFSAHTAANVGQRMAIVLDREVISAPNINDAISGQGVISGSFSEDEAKSLAIQLRYGALPVPLDVAAFDNVGPTLGRISVNRSIEAGVIGVIVVLLFMVIYYRVPGVAAALALLVFAAMNFALYKSIPVTLTLPAITGFLISIGSAVDGNILIFERMKEELRAGKTLSQSVRLGFDRAWTSIRDSNISTLLICGILFFFGSTFGASAVQGFAITLGLGLVLNLFTAIIVTRTFLNVLLNVFGKAVEGNKRLLGA